MTFEKTTHELEDEPGSPHPNKKRRTDSGFGDSPDVKEETDIVPEDPIEQTLVAALVSPPVEAVSEPIEDQPVESNTENNAEKSSSESAEAPDPEVAAVYGSIIDRAERLEEQYALDQLPAESSEQSSNKSVTFVKASLSLKIQSLPILDNLVCIHGSCRQRSMLMIILSLHKYFPSWPSPHIKTSRHLSPSPIQKMVRHMPLCGRYSIIQKESILQNMPSYRQPTWT